MISRGIFGGLGLALCLSISTGARAQTAAASGASGKTFGHSMQGEAFDDGPRQKAVLIPGTPKLNFPVTTKRRDAAAFVAQGVAQLHAYWYFEAERSFRQAAALDPDCAMAFWGMSLANTNNRARAKEFSKVALAKKANVTEREKLYIDAAALWCGATPPPKDTKADVAALDAQKKLVAAFPDDIEAKAFLGHTLMEKAASKPAEEEAEAVLKAVLDANPMHPVHHYRIHLFDEPGNERALNSALRSGPAQPASAHMWHMAGHTFTDLTRFADAAWAQEASARTDHAHMRRAHILPDQIFNFAHNNQWLVSSLQAVGRARDAVSIATNMVELPRHPKYNTLRSSGSASYGGYRLVQTLRRFDLWETARALDKRGILEPEKEIGDEAARRVVLCWASFDSGETRAGLAHVAAIQKLFDDAGEKQKTNLAYQLAEAKLAAALALGKQGEALALAETALAPARIASMSRFAGAYGADEYLLDPSVAARLWLKLGQPEKAETIAAQAVKDGPNQALPLASLISVLWAQNKRDDAAARFEQLRKLAGRADLDAPPFLALSPIADALKLPRDWRLAPPADPAAAGFRPKLDSLGPLVWSPYTAPKITLKTRDNRKFDLSQPGRPTLVVFVLGAACGPCLAQIDLLAAKKDAFGAAGIDIVTVTPDETAELVARKDVVAKNPFPLVQDTSLKTYKAFGAYDDFENQPLHGVFLIAPDGRVLWQDTGASPFKDIDFLLNETRRLLALNAPNL